MNELGVSLGEAERFLTLLSEDEEVTFQTFSDRDETKVKKANGEPYDPLAHIRHGSLEHHGRELQGLNRGAAGIFIAVNATDGHGRKAENVTRVRAVFVDLDGAPLPKTWGLEPHLVVESSPGRFHAYWLVADCPLERFTSIQKAIAARFGGDPSVHDLPRVMRLPGFLHQKAEPFMTRILHENPIQPYPLAEIITGLGLDLTNGGTRTGPRATDDGRIPEGGRNTHLASLAGSMRWRGMSQAAIKAALLAENAERCDPPLLESEVRRIAASVSRYEPSGEEPPSQAGEAPPPWEDPPVESYADDPECRGQGPEGAETKQAEETILDIGKAVLSFADLLKAAIPERKRILPWLPEGGLCMVYSPRGLGKTFFELGLAHALTSGTPFMKWEDIFGVGVLYIDGEMPLGETRERLQGFIFENPKAPLEVLSHERFYQQFEKDLVVTDPDVQHALLTLLDAKKKLRVVILTT